MITGKYRGKKLFAPADNRIRPTSDRVKETAFNMLYSKGYGADIRVLDLFAGTGGMGIEALSRGAGECVFTDIDKKSCACVHKNLAHTGASGEVYHADYKTALLKLAGRAFDVIFIDPPFASRREADAVGLILQHGVLAKGGVIVIEHAADNPLDGLPTQLNRESRACGNTVLTFLSYKE